MIGVVSPVIVCLWVATIFGSDIMPHVHSASARASRRLRAAFYGFSSPKPAGHSHLLVEDSLLRPVRVMTAAVRTHAELDRISGARHHFLSHSALAARQHIPERDYRRAMQLNKMAGKAKHDLAFADNKYDLHFPPLPRAPLPSGLSVRSGRSPWADLVDADLVSDYVLDSAPSLPTDTSYKDNKDDGDKDKKDDDDKNKKDVDDKRFKVDSDKGKKDGGDKDKKDVDDKYNKDGGDKGKKDDDKLENFRLAVDAKLMDVYLFIKKLITPIADELKACVDAIKHVDHKHDMLCDVVSDGFTRAGDRMLSETEQLTTICHSNHASVVSSLRALREDHDKLAAAFQKLTASFRHVRTDDHLHTAFGALRDDFRDMQHDFRDLQRIHETLSSLAADRYLFEGGYARDMHLPLDSPDLGPVAGYFNALILQCEAPRFAPYFLDHLLDYRLDGQVTVPPASASASSPDSARLERVPAVNSVSPPLP